MTLEAQQCVADGGLINPEMFPAKSADLDTSTITAAADDLVAMGEAVKSETEEIDTAWAGLQGSYAAPHQEQVFALIDPAVTSAETLRSTFARAAGHLETYASTLEGIKPRLASVESRAASFRARVVGGVWVDASEASDASAWEQIKGLGDWIPGVDEEQKLVPWNEDTDTVDENNELLDEANGIFAEIMNAAAACANSINALLTGVCVAPIEEVSAESFSDPSTPMPWGSPATEDRNCTESVGHGAGQFWDSTWKGAAMLVGYDAYGEDTWSWSNFGWDTAGQAWGGLVDLVGSIALSPVVLGTQIYTTTTGNSNGFTDFMWDRAETISGLATLVAIDPTAEDPFHRWKEDGIAAFTESGLNVATFFIPGAGQAGAAVKGAGTAARLTRVANVAADLALPGGSWIVRGGVRVVQGIGDLVRFGDDVPLPRGAVDDVVRTGSRADIDGLISRVGDDVPSGAGRPGPGTSVVPDRPVSDDFFGNDRGSQGGTGPEGAGSRAGEPESGRGEAEPGRAGEPDGSRAGEAESGRGETESGSGEAEPGRGDDARPAQDRGPAVDSRYLPPEPAQVVEVREPGVNTTFERLVERGDVQLEPNTRYDVEGRGSFTTDATGTVTHVETSFGTERLNPDLHRPLPNATYVVDDYAVYVTDADRFTVELHVERPELGAGRRSEHVQSKVGDLGGEGYDGGHLLASFLGGGGESINLEAMLADVNRSVSGFDNYYSIETTIRNALGDDPSRVGSFHVYAQHAPGNAVPDRFRVQYTIDGRIRRRTFNNMGG